MPETGDRAHDAVGFEYPRLAVRSEGCGHIAERLRLQKGVRLEELRAGEPGAADPRDRGIRFALGQRPGIIVPEPPLQFARGRAADFELHATKPCRDGRLPYSRVRQVREDAQLGHRNPAYRLTPREVLPPAAHCYHMTSII